ELFPQVAARVARAGVGCRQALILWVDLEGDENRAGFGNYARQQLAEDAGVVELEAFAVSGPEGDRGEVEDVGRRDRLMARVLVNPVDEDEMVEVRWRRVGDACEPTELHEEA